MDACVYVWMPQKMRTIVLSANGQKLNLFKLKATKSTSGYSKYNYYETLVIL